ncbi:hypothetical protein HFP66_26455 [Bacillus sp. A17A.1]
MESLAKRLEQLRKGDKKREIPPLIPMERGEAIPLSYAQQRLWFIDQFTPNSALYNMPMVCRLTGIGYLKHWKRMESTNRTS